MVLLKSRLYRNNLVVVITRCMDLFSSFLNNNQMTEILTDFNLNCRACQRLVTFLDDVAEEYPSDHARPVPQFGAKNV